MRAFVERMIWEIRMFEMCGHFADGEPWGKQAWWRIECFEAFWAGQAAGREREGNGIS